MLAKSADSPGSLVFVSAGQCDRPPERIIKPMVHSSWSLALNSTRGLRLRFGKWNGAWLPHAADELLLIRPGTTTWTDESRAGKRFRSAYVLFQTQGDEALSSLFKKGESHLFMEDPGGVASGLLRKMAMLAAAKRSQGHYDQELDILGQLVAILATAKRQGPNRYKLPSTNPLLPPDPLVASVKAWMQQNLQTTVTREAVARQAGISLSGLSQHVSKVTGGTLMGLLRQLRVERGAQLLAQGWTIEAASMEAGFADVSHFSRVFKKLTGVTPGRHARQQRAGLPKTAPEQTSLDQGLIAPATRRSDADPVAVPLYFENATRDQLDASSEVTLHYWTLDYYFTDGVSVRLNSKKGSGLACPAGTAHIYPPETHFWEDSRKAGGHTFEGSWVYFHPLRINLKKFIGPQNLIRLADPDGELAMVMREMQDVVGKRGFLAEHQAALAPALENVFRLLIGASLRDGCYVIGKSLSSAGNADFVRRVDELLRQNLHTSIHRTALARALNVSVSLLAHRYREATGEGPKQALNRMRLEKAKELLSRGASVKEAARECGFADAHYLARCFRSSEGMTPKAFRSIVR